jgi:cobalt-zinc-cadmium efflux system protein
MEHHQNSIKNIKFSFFLNLGFTILEIIGGFYTNSIAILSDAIHDLGDCLSLGIAWRLEKKSKQSADKDFSFGYARYSLLGAFVTGAILLISSAYILIEAINRLSNPEPSNADGMIILAIIGIAANGYAAFKLSRGKSMNEKMVSLHLLEDVAGWILVLIGAIIMKFYDLPIIDPILSILLTCFILWNVVKRLKETINIFLQKTPKDIPVQEIESKILDLPNVKSIHHMHVWSLEGQHHVFTAHIRLENINTLSEVVASKEQIKDILRQYPFKTYTLETDVEDEPCNFEDEENELNNG